MSFINDVIVEGTVYNKRDGGRYYYAIHVAETSAIVELEGEGANIDKAVALVGVPVLIRGKLYPGSQDSDKPTIWIKNIEKGRAL